MQTIVSHPAKNCKTFSTVTPMKVVGYQRPKPRPRPKLVTCRGCGGSKIETYFDKDTDGLKDCTCRFCGGTGVVAYAGTREEHRDWLQQLRGLGGMAWSAVKAVML